MNSGIISIMKLDVFTKGECEKKNRRGARTEPGGPSAFGTVIFIFILFLLIFIFLLVRG